MYYIYKHLNKDNEVIYVGLSPRDHVAFDKFTGEIISKSRYNNFI